jgi:TANK-binding kinase 1
VKIFNDAAKARSITLQSRELDLLRKIKHENVVKLIDKEDQIVCNNYYLKMLVMEYCNGGSLSSIIEQPENIYGLQQSEFLLVLKHISKKTSLLGWKRLRSQV